MRFTVFGLLPAIYCAGKFSQIVLYAVFAWLVLQIMGWRASNSEPCPSHNANN